jgi:hypothetical protein
MQEQSDAGAQWIPACFLEIVLNQVIGTTLGQVHSSDMLRHATHLPARNAGLITEEGIKLLGLSEPANHRQLVRTLSDIEI